MTVSDDKDDAQQIGQDRKLALELQVEENIGFATAQREQVTKENATFEDEASFATAEAFLREQEQYEAANQVVQLGCDEYGEVSSASAVAGMPSLDSQGEEQEDDDDDESFHFVSQNSSSDISSGVMVSDEEKKSVSPVFVSSEDTEASGKRSSDISSSYAAAASSAPSGGTDEIAHGIGVISSVDHLRQDTTMNDESRIAVARIQGRRENRHEYFFDVRDEENGDKIFQALFGEYGDIDPLLVNIKPRHKNTLATNPTALREAAVNVTLEDYAADPKLQLEQYCERTWGNDVPPSYQRLDLTGPVRDRTFETVVQHPLWEDTIFVGKGKTALESEMDAARRALASLLNSLEVAERASNLTISVRAAAAKLPFCLRFQFERSILSDAAGNIPLKMKRIAKADGDAVKDRLIYTARAMMLIYIQVVLPSLLKIDWEEECGGKDCFTLIELFAEEMWEVLAEVKKAIKMGHKIVFQGKVQEALRRARLSLRQAEHVCETTEAKLACNGNTGEEGYTTTIRKRSLWPVAMYSCKFDLNGNLVPTDFQVLNKTLPKNEYVEPQTRRAMREAGWPVRDRFIIISSVKFHARFQERLADWLEENPKLCNRDYEFLFDKGTGKPTIWMYSPSNDGIGASLSRNALLKSLGCFDNVVATKLGDRISLAFTQTTPIYEIPLDCILAEPELVRNGYLFSDGCGVMGPAIARKVQEVLRLKEAPGAIQIRMGGVKGMLSLRHDYPEDKIGIRPSMVKFRSNHRMLEVKQHAYVNENPPLFSQLILVMHQQGVSNQVLLGLQAKACAEMARKYDSGATNIADDFEYTRKIVKHGRKENGRPFSTKEFEELKRNMVQAKTKVNLRCSVRMMYGVIDEHGVLEEGEVMVGNGSIKGPVLVSRSPCFMPGDIQKAIAVAGRHENDTFFQTYSKLKDVLVFSSKGDRPLADCLGGGDLDGDQFYVIDEKDLVEQMRSGVAHDYGSQRNDIQVTVDVQDCFRVADALTPALENQLGVLRKLLNLGDIVAFTSDAWLRVADIEGPGSARAMNMAALCQDALDARKLALKVDNAQIIAMLQIRSELEAPHWRGSGEKSRTSNSILGILYNIWSGWIRDLEAAQRRRLRECRGYHGIDAIGTLDESDSLETDTVVSTETECIICVATGRMQCHFCGGTVWVCSDQCRRWHESEAGHTRGFRETLSQASTLESIQVPDDSHLMPRPMEILLDVVFGRRRPSCAGAETIDFRSLDETDLRALREMVLTEFLQSISDSEQRNRSKPSNDAPRANDVFLMEDGELAVCRRPHADGDLMWFDKNDNPTNMNSALPIRRVASLSGVLRVLESLVATPAAGSLMEQAMKRDVVCVAASTENIVFDSANVHYLNESQRQVVETVLSMKSGILAVQGPPGCGKSCTIVEIVLAVGGGVIVTAPSNAAVANLALKILSTGQFETKDVVVWGENCEDSVRFLNPVHRHNKFVGFLKRYMQAQRREDEAEMEKLRRDLASWLNLDGATITKMKTLARLDYSDLRGDLSPIGLKAAASAKVLLCTLNTAGSTILRDSVKHKFDLMLLDEGSQAPEAEFYIATTFPGVRRIVVVGDPKQLPATVLHEDCQEAGYADSFLSHVFEYQSEKVHLLNVQYRMDPQILAFSNNTFYSDRVKSDESVLDRKPHVQSPFVVVDTSVFGRGIEQRVYSSWKNEREADVIKAILCNDEDVRLVQSQVVGARTIVITPYKAQEQFLRQELKKIKALCPWDIATVDSFQGQEGDIVIVSTVRTSSVGFTDNPNRLNVALTRSKRVLRVVGNVDFLKEIPDGESALRELANFAERHKIVKATVVSTAHKSPDWRTKTAWKPTMTARFHDCLKPTNMKRMDKDVAFNTLLAVSTPRLGDLTSPPTEHGPPRWQSSSLRKFDERLQIVWIAKELEQHGVALADAAYTGVIEAHFAGSRHECLTFLQKNHLVPRNARRVKRDMTAIIPSENQVATHSTDIELSWKVTNDIQNAVEELPLGLFLLDEYQESILVLKPPLLIESRSGMGKTEILFKHSISYRDDDDDDDDSGQASRTCFVTVSANLCRTLQRRYYDVQEVKQVALPAVSFFSFLGSRVQTETGTESVRSLVSVLLRIYRIPDNVMSVSSSCTFWEFVNTKTSHEKLEVDLSLAENEIGGVILGSLAAAIKKDSLSRAEYMAEKRSNVPIDTDGLRKRHMIYNEFEKYRQWKLVNEKYDTDDIVLRLIREASEQGVKEIFQSVYLDEVQDFSYASLFLICSIAGKTEGRWVAAGDTAQMISPGCSFTFKGLKDTLLEIRHDIELRKVVKLKRNYRMNRGTLEMANAVIKVIKSYFPGAIESYQKEEAMKDLGLKVALLDWEKALAAEKKPSFGLDQAIIYASDVDLDAVQNSMEEWPENEHPFILSSLDSKGLEYDDVIVAFNFERKTWSIEERRTASLRMCRELYVAVTRARRRVVILLKKDVNTMSKFFQNLEYSFEEAEADVILGEFQKQTTAEEWFERGMQLLQEERYKIAASCFKASQDFGWSNYADGLQLLVNRDFQEARNVFRTSAGLFFQNGDFKECLDVFTKIAEIEGPWVDTDSKILDAALRELPDYLPREKTINFALVRGSWNVISVGDLIEYSQLFRGSRGNPNLTKIVQECSEDDRIAIEQGLPLVVGDYRFGKGRLADATRLFLVGVDYDEATSSTEAAIRDSNEDLPRIATFWRWDKSAREKLPDSHPVSLLVSLFESPKKAAANHANDCMRMLGPSIVKLAINNAEDAGVEELHMFSRTAFKTEVLAALTERYRDNLIKVVHWYCERDDKEGAATFVASNLSDLSDDDLSGVILKDKELRPNGLLTELAKRNRRTGILVASIKQCLAGGNFDLEFAKDASDKALASVSRNADEVMKVWNVWNTRRNDPRVSRFLNRIVRSSSTALLYLLFTDPVKAGQQYGKKCMQAFGENVVREAVLKTKGSDKQGAYVVLCTFDKNKFASDKPVESSFKVGDRIVVKGLTKGKSSFLNGKPGVVKALNKNRPGSYHVVLDSDKKGAKPWPLNGANLEKTKPSRTRGQTGRYGGNDSSSDSDSSSSAPARPPRKQKSRGARSSQKQQAADADDSSMPTLIQEGHKSSSSDDDSTDQESSNGKVSGSDGSDDMPDLESKQSSAESSDSQNAFPKNKRPAANRKKGARVPTHVYAGQKESDTSSSEDDESVPPLQKRAPQRGDDSSSSDSALSSAPDLLSGQNSSDGSSEAVEPARNVRNMRSDDLSDDSSEAELEPARVEESSLPSLEAPRGSDSSSNGSSSGSSNKPPVLVPRPQLQDSSDSDNDSSNSSNDDVPALVDRDGRIADTQARAQAAAPPSRPTPSQDPQPLPPRNASGSRKKKGKGRRGKGGRGKR